MDKFMKSGYQNKHDPLRARAEEWLGHYAKKAPGIIYSASAEDKEKDQHRLYKNGGHIKKEHMEHKKEHKHKEHMEHKNEHAKHKEHMEHEEYKKGGKVCTKKFAMGGVAKIRHGEATESGAPKKYKKEPFYKMR